MICFWLMFMTIVSHHQKVRQGADQDQQNNKQIICRHFEEKYRCSYAKGDQAASYHQQHVFFRHFILQIHFLIAM